MVRVLLYVLGILLILALGVGIWVFRLIVISGQFTTLKPQLAQECRAVKAPGMIGVEDIVIDHASGFAFLAAHDRRAAAKNGTAKDDQKVPEAAGVFLTKVSEPGLTPQSLTRALDGVIKPHGISLYSGSDGQKVLGVISHPTLQTTEIFLFNVVEDRSGGGAPVVSLSLRRRIGPDGVASFNDLHLTGPEQFYATVDKGSQTALGEVLETWLALARSRVEFFDGTVFKTVATDLKYSNGIHGSADGGTIYVAEVLNFGMRVFTRDVQSNSLKQVDMIHVGAGLDNLDIDAKGRIWAAAHPHLLDFVRHSVREGLKSPSQIVRFTLKPGGGGVAEQVFLDLGEGISGGSVAAVHDGRMLIGSVFEPHILNCKAPE